MNAGTGDERTDSALRVAVAVPAGLRDVFFPPDVWTKLEHTGELIVVDGDHRDPATFRDLVTRAAVVVTAWGCPPLNTTILQTAPDLRLLAHTGASVKSLVTAASWARGVRVTQAGQPMATAVADAALAHTLALLHRLHRFDHAMRRGVPWAEAQHAPPRHELSGSTIGVIGASRAGRAYIERVRALGGVVVVHDPYLDDQEASRLGAERLPLDDLLRRSRVVAIHAPALPETRHLLGRRELALMPDEALLVNTARAWLVDHEALLDELRSGRIDAALDVYDEEPLPVNHPLRHLHNVLLVPHQAGGTIEARHRAGHLIVDEINRFAAGEPLRHEVTADMITRMG